MFGILGLGFLLGMQHALEADHIAAVSSIAARRTNILDIVKHGLTWGMGHTLTLAVFAGAALALGHAIPEHLSQRLETAVGIMLVFSGTISDFVNRHPSMKILALSFLLLIGVMLLAEGMGQHVSKGYIYFAMAFSLVVELLNMRMRKNAAPVTLHDKFET